MLKIWSIPLLDEWVLVFDNLIQILYGDEIDEVTNKTVLNLSDSS